MSEQTKDEPQLTEAEAQAKLEEFRAEFENARVKPKSLSVDDLDDEQQKLLNDAAAQLGDDVEMLQVLQYLLMHSWDVSKAVDGVKEYREWRDKQGFDEALANHPPIRSLVTKLVPGVFHGVDKEGHPIYVERTGRIMGAELLQYVDEKEFVWNHACIMEDVVRRLTKEASENAGKPIRTFTTILDLDGLSLYHRNCLGLVQASTEMDDKYYPNLVHNILVINAPWFIPGIWEIVQMFLSESMKSKLHVLNSPEELLDFIDADQLPKHLGGTADVEVPTYTHDEVMVDINAMLGDVELVEDYVAAGDVMSQEESLKAGDTLKWVWNIKDGYDIHFTVKSVLSSGGDEENVVVELERGVMNKGSYTAPEECTVTVEFDNTYSFFYGKYLNHCISVDRQG